MLSKILERILFEQISVYLDKFLSDQKCGSRRGYTYATLYHKFIRKIEELC